MCAAESIPALVNEVRSIVHWTAMQKEFERTIGELSAEREAHEEPRRHWQDEHQNGVELTREIHALKSQLTSTRADLDALTKLSNDIESVWGSWHCDSSYVDNWVDGLNRIRAAFAALAAWKARKGAGDGL